jgi:hypothetical protein
MRAVGSKRPPQTLNRVGWLFLALLMFASVSFEVLYLRHAEETYEISSKAQTLLGRASPTLAESLKLDRKTSVYNYNQGYRPGGEVVGLTAIPKFTGSFSKAAEQGATITDPVSTVSINFKPQFALAEPQQAQNRLIYPLKGRDAQKVYSLKSIGMKEDIILNSFQGDSVAFEYQLGLPDGTEARMESNGSLAVYGVQQELLANVSTGSDKDAELLQKARQNAPKKTLLFTFPAPFVKEFGEKVSSAKARFELKGDILILHASGLSDASYPLSVDPSIYIESAAKLMRGNNETNVDFDIDNELIQKSQTTGARIDAWEDNLDMSEGIWDGGTAATGGYVYRAGGRTGALTKPRIVDQQSSNEDTEATSFVMNMPGTRPAGDLYVALMCHDGTGSPTAPAGGGWTLYADADEHAAYYKVGTDAGGGNEASSYTWTGASEEWYGVIVRIEGADTSDPVSGTPGTNDAGSGIGSFPATTPDSSATLVIRAVGNDDDVPSESAWVPSGHTKIDSGNSGGASGDCGFAAASLDVPPVSGVSTGTTSLDDDTLDGTFGSSSIAVNPAGTPPPPQIEDSQFTTSGDGTFTTFTMNMPATRPAGDLYVAMLCHDDDLTPGIPSGWTLVPGVDQDEFAAYYKIGTDQGGGNEAASYNWTLSTGEEWAGVIVRVSGFDSSDIFSGTPGTTNASGTPGTFPATTPDNNKTLILRSIGADDDAPSVTTWVPSGHTKIASGSSSATTNDCGFVAAAMNNAPASGVSTGTVNMGDSWLNDTYGGATFAINPEPSSGSSESVRSSVNWARFNSSTHEIESPNPGTGACSGWCNDTSYDLPAGRRAHSMVAYNGYLYVMGGVDSGGSRVSTIYIAKLGANGEPQLWHPTDTNKDNWDYWYTGASLSGSTAKSYFAAAAYNNRIYVLGGETVATPNGVITVEVADILPNGLLGSWTTTGMQALPSGAGTHMHSVQIYNDVLYTIGGFEGATTSSANLRNAVYYSRLNSDGTMNAWQSTGSFSGARSNYGGSFTTIWGGYIYLGGGCTAVNGSGYCTTVASDMQLVSINADGSLAEWNTILGLNNARIGYTFIAWQGGLYRLGGCTEQNGSNGVCSSTLADVDFGVINPDGEASTVATSVASGNSPCSGGSPYSCNLPSGVGNVLNASVVANGYLYVMGGCANDACSSYSSGIVYQAVGSDGTLKRPASCAGTYTDSYCVSSVSLPSARAAPGVAVFNGRIYLVGGFPDITNISYVAVNSDGSLGTWSNTDFTDIATGGIDDDLSYTFAYARANPSSAGSTPGNLFIFGGCTGTTSGVGCSSYSDSVYKCNISTAGVPSSCVVSGQVQIGTATGASGTGLGAHAGAVYANYIYLMGGLAPGITDLTTVRYAKFDDSNNVVTAGGGGWVESASEILVGRRRGAGFGYNGFLYVAGGYDGSDALADIEYAKINVSTGDVEAFSASTVSIDKRWGLTMPVSNSYAYVIGGCIEGPAPTGCTSRTSTIQTFQIYNNDSGAVKEFTSFSDDTFAADTDRWGASSAVLNGYLYVAGGCISATDCSNATANVQYAPISSSDGSIGTWSSAGNNLLADRAWGQLEVAGGYLYYLGGQDDGGDEKSEVYYAGTFSSGDVSSAWQQASGGIGDTNSQVAQDRTKFGATVWNNRIYIVAGLDDSAAVTNTVYISPQLNSGGNIAADSWASDADVPDVARLGNAVTAYANNLYSLGGNDGTNYLNDAQFAQINSDGTIDAWTFTTSMSGYVSQGEAFAANGYMYVVGGRSAASSCAPNTLLAPISANTTISSGNNPTGVGEWFETNVRYAGGRYGAAVAYDKGKMYVTGGGCTSPQNGTYSTGTITQSTTTVTGSGTTWTDNYIGGTITYQDASTATIVSVTDATHLVVSASKTIGTGQTYSITVLRHVHGVLKSQPQVAKYSRMIDTDTDVFPNSWLMNGVDNSIGARWQARYRSMNDTDGVATDCGTADMTTWGQETNHGDVILGNVELYTPKDGSGNNINCARYYYFFVSIDASQTFGYPEDVARGPTITDLSLFFTSDPSKRLRHGKTFTGGEQQPLDTPCRRGSSSPGDPNYNCPLP